MSSTRISKISSGDTSTPLHIRVIKKWRPHNKRPEICYLFVDIHGDGIEAVADANEEQYFDSIINVQSCYIVTKYLCVPSRQYMAVVPHKTSLKIGKIASFQPIINNDIPSYYFNFAPYNLLDSRKMTNLLLTDFIGRVERIRTVTTKTNKVLTKIMLQDEGEHLIEITLWEKKIFQQDFAGTIGQIMAITSTIVTEYIGTLQLEATPATTITINPLIPELSNFP